MAVETERRKTEEPVSKLSVEEVASQISERMRVGLMEFLSSESCALMAFTNLGEFKAYAIARFKGILHITVKRSLETEPLPTWAADRVIEA